jgi:hypothetical protein
MQDGRPFPAQQAVKPPKGIPTPFGRHSQIENGNAQRANLVGYRTVPPVKASDGQGVSILIHTGQEASQRFLSAPDI